MNQDTPTTPPVQDDRSQGGGDGSDNAAARVEIDPMQSNPAEIGRQGTPVDTIRIPDPWFMAQERLFEIAWGMDRREDFPFVIPPFQRGLVWTLEQKIALIESIWMKLPIGVYVYNRGPRVGAGYDMWLLDGQQRWDAIYSYLDDEFPIYGLLWSELTDIEKRRFRHNKFVGMETNFNDEATLRDIFERLAYGGTPNVRDDSSTVAPQGETEPAAVPRSNKDDSPTSVPLPSTTSSEEPR